MMNIYKGKQFLKIYETDKQDSLKIPNAILFEMMYFCTLLMIFCHATASIPGILIVKPAALIHSELTWLIF